MIKLYIIYRKNYENKWVVLKEGFGYSEFIKMIIVKIKIVLYN